MSKKTEAAAAEQIAKVAKAVHMAAAKALRNPKLPAQSITLKAGSGAGTAMMQGKLAPPVQPSFYVAVIVPVYGKLSDPVQPS